MGYIKVFLDIQIIGLKKYNNTKLCAILPRLQT